MPFNNTIKLTKTPQMQGPDEQTLRLIHDFVCFAKEKLELPTDELIQIKLLGANPKEPITTGAFDPSSKKICAICQNRHFIDYARTIAHEMVHLKQLLGNELVGEFPEIGGKIEDDANAISGQIMKEYIKTKLTPENKKYLGLGTF
jgi:hypothetical protein